MLRKLFTTISTILIFAAAAVPASAQMSDDQVLSYAKQAIASGQSTTAIVQELASKGVTMDQIQRVQATVNGATGMNALSGTVSTVGGQERMRRVADKYANYDKVIFVGHVMAFRTLTYIEQMKPAQIVECEYYLGQEDCIYSFY